MPSAAVPQLHHTAPIVPHAVCAPASSSVMDIEGARGTFNAIDMDKDGLISALDWAAALHTTVNAALETFAHAGFMHGQLLDFNMYLRLMAVLNAGAGPAPPVAVAPAPLAPSPAVPRSTAVAPPSLDHYDWETVQVVSLAQYQLESEMWCGVYVCA